MPRSVAAPVRPRPCSWLTSTVLSCFQGLRWAAAGDTARLCSATHQVAGYASTRRRGPSMAVLPRGTVTFLFTDLEGSTRLWERFPEPMADAYARHDAVLRETV